MSAYPPTTGQACGCTRGVERDNCPQCEGTGQRIDFARIRAKSQHRPGPWQIGRTLWMQDDRVYDEYPDNERGASIMVEVTDGPGTDENAIAWVFAEDQRDEYIYARLIAAAPALLAALERTQTELYRLAMKAPDLNPNVDYILDQARAALAQATGGRP